MMTFNSADAAVTGEIKSVWNNFEIA